MRAAPVDRDGADLVIDSVGCGPPFPPGINLRQLVVTIEIEDISTFMMGAQKDVPVIVDLNVLLRALLQVDKVVLSVDVHGLSLVEDDGGPVISRRDDLVDLIIVQLKVSRVTRYTRSIINKYHSVDVMLTSA